MQGSRLACLALQTQCWLLMPGTQHMVHNTIQAALGSMSFFPNYLEELKSIIKFLRPRNNRSALRTSGGEIQIGTLPGCASDDFILFLAPPSPGGVPGEGPDSQFPKGIIGFGPILARTRGVIYL
jgi:hypothetical protein